MTTLNSEVCLSEVPLFEAQEDYNSAWFIAFLGCLTASYAFTVTGLIQQYRISKDVSAREADYEKFDSMLKKLYPWEKA